MSANGLVTYAFVDGDYLTSQPTLPASGTPYTNTLAVPAYVFVGSGTITVVAVNGVSQPSAYGWFTVPSDQTITLTYTGSPSWTWWQQK